MLTRSARRGARTHRPGAVPYLFMLPATVLFVTMLALPIGYTGYLSLRRIKVTGLGLGRGSHREVFAGGFNYRAAVSDSALWAGWGRVLVYGTLVLVVMLGLALLFALLMDSARARLTRFARVSIFLPYAVPGVIATVLWGFLYLPTVSPISDALSTLHLPKVDFLGAHVLPSMANVAVWGGTGFNMIVLYTALRAVPPELYEAATVDGASEVQIALRVKIPLLMPAIILTTVFSIIATLQVFTEPMTLRPLTNSIGWTWSPLMKVYRDAFVNNNIYGAAATAVIIAVVALVLSFGFLRLVRDRAFGEAS